MNEDYSGLRAQDLQEAKDQLLVETADMLNIPLFTAEALLRNHEWSREMLLEAWMSDPLVCCENSGVTPPASLYCDKPQIAQELTTPTTPHAVHDRTFTDEDLTCEICTCLYSAQEESVKISCDHQFCRDCWVQYLTLRIKEGEAHSITCPGFECSRLVPVEVIEGVVSRDVALKYLQFDIQAFVERNPSIKWCPFPGCGNAVRLPDMETSSTASPTIKSTTSIPPDSSRAVDCGNGHLFCWECLGEAHEPGSCENWKKWCDKVAEVKPETLHGTDSETELAANCLWLVTNSKPCPNCKSPIQKNEGCNHMKCSKCKHDFCWVCLEQWKRHNSSTGGYFKCNRYEAVTKVREANNAALTEAEQNNNRLQELNRFVHYYTRFKNHENSFKLEEPLIRTARDKMMKLAEAVTDLASANEETKFVANAVTQLLKARRILCFSYVYAYYLDGPGYKKIVFEFMQTELEEATEILSQMVNRLYLRTPRKKIIDQAARVQRKRQEFISAIAQGLVPAETPPSLRRKHRRRYSMDSDDDEMRQAILASINDFDATNPWIKDACGRHTNALAVLDWPGPEDSDEEGGTAAAKDREVEDNERILLDEHMDFLRAMEMSRMQFLHESGVLTNSDPAPQQSATITREDLEQFIFGSNYRGESKESFEDATTSTAATDSGADNLMNKLDEELERVLSSLHPTEVDPEVAQAMEVNRGLSLPGTPAMCPSPHLHSTHSLQTLGTTHPAAAVASTDSEACCSKDVENSDERDRKISDELIGAVGGYDPDDQEQTPTSSCLMGNMFGIIKDIDVTNIHSSDVDKIMDFTRKDMRGPSSEKHTNKQRNVMIKKSNSVREAWTVNKSDSTSDLKLRRAKKSASQIQSKSENCIPQAKSETKRVKSLTALVEDYLKSRLNDQKSDDRDFDVFTQEWLKQTLDISDSDKTDNLSDNADSSDNPADPVNDTSVITDAVEQLEVYPNHANPVEPLDVYPSHADPLEGLADNQNFDSILV